MAVFRLASQFLIENSLNGRIHSLRTENIEKQEAKIILRWSVNTKVRAAAFAYLFICVFIFVSLFLFSSFFLFLFFSSKKVSLKHACAVHVENPKQISMQIHQKPFAPSYFTFKFCAKPSHICVCLWIYISSFDCGSMYSCSCNDYNIALAKALNIKSKSYVSRIIYLFRIYLGFIFAIAFSSTLVPFAEYYSVSSLC